MEVILLEKIGNLGGLGDKVTVRPGYGRNYLIPQGKAKPATEANLQEFEARRAELEAQAQARLADAEARKEAMEAMTITISAKAGDEGKLFGSVGAGDIAGVLSEYGIPADRHEVRMPDGPLRSTGTYEVGLHLHTDVNARVTVVIEAEGTR